MYQIFIGLMKKPMVLIGTLIAITIAIGTVTSGVSSVATALGFNTKENLILKVEKTTNELEKAVAIIENNTTEQTVKDEIAKITDEKVKADAVLVNTLEADESKVLEQIKNTQNYTEPEPVETVKSSDIIKPPSKQLVSIRTISKPKVLTNKHKIGLAILKDRANKLKGARI